MSKFIKLYQKSERTGFGEGELHVNVDDISAFSEQERRGQGGGRFPITYLCMRNGEQFYVCETPGKIAAMIAAVQVDA